MEKDRTERERTARNCREEQTDRLRDTILTELADVLPLEAYAPNIKKQPV